MKAFILVTGLLFSFISSANAMPKGAVFTPEIMGIILQHPDLSYMVTIKPPSAPGADDGDISEVVKAEVLHYKESADKKIMNFDVLIYQAFSKTKDKLFAPDKKCAEIQFVDAKSADKTKAVKVRDDLWAYVLFSYDACGTPLQDPIYEPPPPPKSPPRKYR